MTTEPEKPPAQEAQERELQWRLLRRTLNTLRTYISRLLQVSNERKPEIYKDIFRASELSDLSYWLEIFFSIGIATLGLIISSPAVVIGAMLISPLMGPIFGFGLALALGDFYLGFKSFLNLVLSILASVALAALVTWVLPFHSPTPEILARVQPTLLDLGVAVLSGMAGAIVLCRGGKGGGVTALPGVAVAVALMPPLGVIGFGVGIGWDWTIVKGSGLLFLTNLVAIILSSFLVFFAVRMDTQAVRSKINEWVEEQEKTEKFHEFIERTPLRKLLGRVGSLPQRLLILMIFLALVAFPLGSTLERLRQEAQVRRVVQEEMHKAIPRDSIVNENLELLPEGVRIRVVAVLPEGFSSDQRQDLETLIQARTGLPAKATVYSVATREDVSQLAAARATAAPPRIESVEELRGRLMARVDPAVSAAWPGEQAPLLGYQIAFDNASNILRIDLAYLGSEGLAQLGEAAVRKSLRDRLATPSLEVRFERVAPETQISFALRADAIPSPGAHALVALAGLLARLPGTRCRIVLPVAEGKEPTELQKQRREAVRKYLVESKKVTADRIEVVAGQFLASNGRGDGDKIALQLLPPK